MKINIVIAIVFVSMALSCKSTDCCNAYGSKTKAAETSNNSVLNLKFESKLCKRFSLAASKEVTDYYRLWQRNQNMPVDFQDPCNGRFEASGVDIMDGNYFIALDNTFSFLKVPYDQQSYTPKLGDFSGAVPGFKDGNGFEGVAIDRSKKEILFGIESIEEPHNKYIGGFVPFKTSSERTNPTGIEKIVRKLVVDEETGNHSNRFASENKGYEGIHHLSGFYKAENGNKYQYLFMLCEGNYCAVNSKLKEHKKAGNGVLHIYRRKQNNIIEKKWSKPLIVQLGTNIPFQDYSGLDIHWNKSTSEQNTLIGQVLISSQEDKKVWIGQLKLYEAGSTEASFSHKKKKYGLTIENGNVFEFRSKTNGTVDSIESSRYCNIEGVAWLGDPKNHTIVAVSDAYKKGKQPANCQSKDQSIHIFSF